MATTVKSPTVILFHKYASSPPSTLFTFFHTPNSLFKHSLSLSSSNALYSTRTISISSASASASASTTELPRRLRRQKLREVPEDDAISTLNERIHREHGKREATRKPSNMDREEANKYIQLVKEQQQRGLNKLKGERQTKHSADGNITSFSYTVDPYTLQPGDYVVHKKVGIGRFVGIKYDTPKDSNVSIEYVFIEYADGMAKLPVKQSARFLYRYNLYVLLSSCFF